MEDKITLDRSVLEGWAQLTSPDALRTVDPAWVCGFLHFVINAEISETGEVPHLKIIK